MVEGGGYADFARHAASLMSAPNWSCRKRMFLTQTAKFDSPPFLDNGAFRLAPVERILTSTNSSDPHHMNIPSEALIPALIAALVSLSVAGISYFAVSRKIRSDARNVDRQLSRDLALKLFELRLAKYGQAYEITDKIRMVSEDAIFSDSVLLAELQHDLRVWRNGQVQLILSRRSINAFRLLDQALEKKPGGKAGSPNAYTDVQLRNIYEARTELRRALRSDIAPLHIGDLMEKSTTTTQLIVTD